MSKKYLVAKNRFTPGTPGLTIQGFPGCDVLADFKNSTGDSVLKVMSNGELVWKGTSQISTDYFKHLNIFTQTCLDTIQIFIDNPNNINHCRVADMGTNGGHCGMEFRTMCSFFERLHGKEMKIIGELSQDLLTCIEFVAAFQTAQETPQ